MTNKNINQNAIQINFGDNMEIRKIKKKNISNKVLSDKDKIIEKLKDEIKKLDTELKAYKTKGWFYY